MFMQPIELLEKVVLIYCTVPSDDHPGDRVAEERKLAPCRLRILNLLKKWIHQHKYDFEHPAMMQLVNDFCHSTLKLTGYERVAENLLQMLCSSTFPAPLPCPEPIPLRRRGPNEPLELSDVDPLELARQMTLDDMLLYTSLEPRDFLNCAWSKKEDPNASPSIRAMIQQFNATAEWVAGLVLNAADEVQRVKYIRHFILTASELLKMNNFNSCVKILGSLSGQAIHRLHTWERLQREDLKIFQDLKSLIGQNWAGLRELMATCFSPSIPLISPFLGDLTYIDEMKSRSGKNMLNFRKLTLTAQAIDKVLAHVEVRYWFTEISEVRRWIQHLETTGRLSADAAHAKSLLIQPRIPS
jgi:son of sevenless-like protein